MTGLSRIPWPGVCRAIGLWALILVLVTHGHDEYLILFAFIMWQQADGAQLRSDLKHVHIRLDIVADAVAEHESELTDLDGAIRDLQM